MPKCKVTVLQCNYYPELASEYCYTPDPGPCDLFRVGQEYLIDKKTYFSNGPEGFCGEAWGAIRHYIYAALQGGSIMKGWMKDEKVMITCCNDGVRPVIFKLERVDG